jgi:two-component system OmpR family response regulator
MRVLLLEDDPLLGEGLRDYLRGEGHVVEWCTSIAQADAFRDEPIDVLLLDWQLPDGSGVQWLSRRRARQDTTPAIVLTARDRLDDRIRGLDEGADDYMVKPFAPEELAARIRAIGRRGLNSPGSMLQFGDVQIDLAARAVHQGEQRVELTGREWAVLEALARRAGWIVPKADLERLVHGAEGEVMSNALEVHVSALRRKLGRQLIETIRGLGYRIERP